MARAPGSRDYRDGDIKDPEGKSATIKRRSGPSTGDQQDSRWWEKHEKDCADSVTSILQRLQKAQEARLRNMVRNARIYGNLGTLNTGSSAFGTLLQPTAAPAAKRFATYNAAQSGADTLVSHIGQTKPRPYYLTSGGNYRQQRQAKKLTQFTDGFFYEVKAYRKGPQIFRDGLVWGDGFGFIYAKGGKLHLERVIGAELWVDEIEAQYGAPRNMHRVKVVDRDELAARWPEHRTAIFEAPRAVSTTQGSVNNNLSDMVTVAQSWHLGALNEDGELVGGKSCVTLVGSPVMLEEPEDWDFDFFPFARFTWSEPLVGYWGQGGIEQVSGKQMWLNELCWTVQKSMRLAGTIKVAMEFGSKVVDEHINNEIGSVLKHSPGKPPTFFTAAPIDPSFFMEVRQAKEDIYEQLGVSQLSATNQKPAGLDSKPALREYKDTQNDRHRTPAEAYDEFFLQVANIGRAIATTISGYKVRVPGATGFRVIDFDDLKGIKDEALVLQMFPVSQLPRDPAGRTQTIQEWVQAGWLTPRQGRKLMDFPDLQSANTMADAQEELILEVLDAIIDDGEYAPPEPTDDLALAKELVLQYLQLYRRLELEPEKLELLRTYNAQVDELMAKALAPLAAAPPMAAGPEGTPQGTPAPAPQAELLPQAA